MTSFLLHLTFALMLQGGEPPPPMELPVEPSAELDRLVVPAPEPNLKRRPETDIRRHLRPGGSILQALSELDRSLHDALTRQDALQRLRDRVQGDLKWREEAFDSATEALTTMRLGVEQGLFTLARIQEAGSLAVTMSQRPQLDWAGLIDYETSLNRAIGVITSQVNSWAAVHALWRGFEIDLERRRRNLAHLDRSIAIAAQQAAWDRSEKEALRLAVAEQAEFYAAYTRDMEKVDEELRRVIARALEEVPNRPRLFIADNRHRVMRPLRKGELQAGYGTRSHLGVRSVWRGTHWVASEDAMRTPSWSEVRTIYWGYVLWTGWVKGLGQVVIMDHTQGYTSVYGHLAEVKAEIGTKVPTGGVIGTMGDTESFFGTRLYLDLRLDGQAQNPLRWL